MNINQQMNESEVEQDVTVVGVGVGVGVGGEGRVVTVVVCGFVLPLIFVLTSRNFSLASAQAGRLMVGGSGLWLQSALLSPVTFMKKLRVSLFPWLSSSRTKVKIVFF